MVIVHAHAHKTAISVKAGRIGSTGEWSQCSLRLTPCYFVLRLTLLCSSRGERQLTDILIRLRDIGFLSAMPNVSRL